MDNSLPVPASGIPFVGLISRLQTAVKNAIPVGYEDHTGFHTGAPPANTEMAVLSIGVFPPPADQPDPLAWSEDVETAAPRS